ncbi:MAG: hypothetical protein WC676_01885 [Candidatus Omnitrophota bacterium]
MFFTRELSTIHKEMIANQLRFQLSKINKVLYVLEEDEAMDVECVNGEIKEIEINLRRIRKTFLD